MYNFVDMDDLLVYTTFYRGMAYTQLAMYRNDLYTIAMYRDGLYTTCYGQGWYIYNLLWTGMVYIQLAMDRDG